MTPRAEGARLLAAARAVPDFTPDITPVEEHGGVLVKREDSWSRSGASGAKARAMFTAAEGAAGLITAGARISPQLERAALVAAALGIPARLHTGHGADTPETLLATAAGAIVLRHRPARLSVIRARYRTDAEARAEAGWACVPFGMDHPAYLTQVTKQAAHLPPAGFDRIVVPVGSGLTLAAILRGLEATGREMPVLGVRVGGDPTAVLDRHAATWHGRVTLTASQTPFTTTAAGNRLGALALDPHYEAKTLPYLRPGDLLWTVGIRASALT
ncbi:pyridoxal-phosphate dependent enzyme [Streptomyces sp. B8F3]|uniref:pyridoxal-phosphate dependent enzyme n=1 Tax=Streptomyces sp. B8F3 TaxID=3153573 RepID=UPI00325EF5C8